jgi:Ribbon-helix-helix protein, copG family
MLRDEREHYDEEARDAIEGLRRLARRIETPPDLRPEVLLRGEQLLPPQQEPRVRWWTVVAGWRPHPLAWGPVVAAAFFVAGISVSWPHAGLLLKDVVSERPSAPAVRQLPQEPAEISPAPPAVSSQLLKREMRQQAERDPASPEPRSRLERSAQQQLTSSSQMKVTATLPAELYEQLQQEAQRRQVSVAAILREAVEAYAHSPRRVD